MKLFSTLMILSLTLAGNAMAQEAEVKALPPGQTLVNLSATEQMNLQQDQLQGSLRIEIDDKQSKVVQDKINKAMQDALALAKSYPDVKVSTGQYYVYQFDSASQPVSSISPKARQMLWKGNQTIDLKSKNGEQLLELAGKIQELGFVMNGLNYTLSPEQEESYKDVLMTGALKKIQARAALAAKTLGKASFEIVQVTIDTPDINMPRPVMFKAARAEMAVASDMSAPVAQSGEEPVTMTVSAQVLLKP